MKNEYSLYDTLLSLNDEKELKAFLQDLCTPKEISALSERWQVAQMLDRDLSYRDISAKTGASTTTVGRVARFLHYEHFSGYRLVLERLKSRNKKTA